MIEAAGSGQAADEVSVAGEVPTDWEELLAAAPMADYSHTAHWHAAMGRHRAGARALWLTVRRDGRLVAGLGAIVNPAYRRLAGLVPLHRLDSSTEGTSGGPLLQPDLAPAEQDRLFVRLCDAFLAQRPRGLATAALALNPAAEQRYGHLLAARSAWVRHDSPTAMVSLAGGIDTVAAERLVMNKRNERNRGLRRGAEIVTSADTALLAEYYPIYASASAHWGQTPTSLGLLQDLLADPQGRVFFTCVRADGRVIGGHLCLQFGERVFAWNGVTDPAYARTHFPATLCFWGDLVEACRRGARWLDFGASGGQDSLAGFKKYFGAEQMERGFYVSDSPGMKVLRTGADWAARRRGGPQGRWHDQTGGGPGPEGSA